MNNFRKYAPALYKQGYEVVPVAEGSKGPKGTASADWQRGEISKQRIKHWVKAYDGEAAGVGIRCASTPSIDIDVYDAEVAEKLVQWCRDNLDGTVVERIGDAPKVLIPCRSQSTGRKVFSKEYLDVLGLSNRIEILREGQQFVSYHVHPDTNKDYYYVSEKELIDVPHSDLPELTDAKIKALMDYFETIAPSSWVPKAKRSQIQDAQCQGGLAALSPKLDIEVEEIRKKLDELPNNDFSYDVWLNVGMGIHHQMPSEEGFNLWEEWSLRSDKHDGKTMRAKWRSFGKTSSSSPITFASVLKYHQEYVTTEKKKEIQGDTPAPDEGEDLSEFLARYAYMPEGNSVVDLERPIHLAVLEVAAFRNLTANKRMEIPAPTVRDPEATKMEPVSKFWLTNAHRMTVEGTTYDPGTDRRISKDTDSRLFLNLAHFPEWASISKEMDSGDAWRLGVFTSHMEYLFPDEKQRRWFINWMAFNVQFPKRRCKVTPLHISRDHGTGRGWLVKVIEQLLGTWNVTKAKMEDLCGSGSKGQYDDYLHQSLVCCIEEVKEADKRYAVTDKLRDQLTEDRLNINLKFGGKGTRDVFTNFFWMSNHEDAIVIPKADRRIHVLSGPNFLQTGEYYDQLYGWLEDEDNLAFLWKTLNEIDLSTFDWKRTPMSDGRTRMIDYNLTTTEEVFNTWLDENEFEFVDGVVMKEQLNAIAERDGFSEMLQDAQIRKLVQHHAIHYKQVRLGGRGARKIRPWYFGSEQNPDYDLEYIRETLEKAEAYKV